MKRIFLFLIATVLLTACDEKPSAQNQSAADHDPKCDCIGLEEQIRILSDSIQYLDSISFEPELVVYNDDQSQFLEAFIRVKVPANVSVKDIAPPGYSNPPGTNQHVYTYTLNDSDGLPSYHYELLHLDIEKNSVDLNNDEIKVVLNFAGQSKERTYKLKKARDKGNKG